MKSRFAEVAWKDYSQFADWLQSVHEDGAIDGAELADLLSRYSDPRPNAPPEWEEEDDVESYLRDPPDPGPLARLEERGWINPSTANQLRCPMGELRLKLGLSDEDVISDIQENALHIVGRCTNPANWDHNRNGLVYGMVQSGKTASMITVITLARKAGYRLFIILAGDKTSLRDQTQNRVNDAFKLERGVNKPELIDSPTWHEDFRNLKGGYLANFRYLDRFSRKDDWTTILVVKKNTAHLKELVNELGHLKSYMASQGKAFDSAFPAIVLDDEADYASQNTDTKGSGSQIHNDIVDLLHVLDRNTYIGYTATPQACLSADPSDPVGYPEHFFWLLEPFMEQKKGVFTPRTYLGAWEVFWEYDTWIVRRMARDEWPHYEKDRRGKSLGVYMPPLPGASKGNFPEVSRKELDAQFLDEVLAGKRPDPPSITNAMMDFVIAAGIRWWRHWRREASTDKPSREHIERRYPHVAAMVHLSETQASQEKVRTLVQKQWTTALAHRKSFNARKSPADHPFRTRWTLQAERTRELTKQALPPFEEVEWFIDRCIEIVETPINNHLETPYRPFPGKPFVYLLNSSDEGMELFYGENDPPEIRTKRAAIFVGGNILSRGLTIEGLTVTVFGRASLMPLGDATLQMGRWFGHRLSTLDLVSIFVQEEIQEVMAQVAEADRYLRLQIKDAIFQGHKPPEVLLELKNSAFFRITSPSKSAFLDKENVGMGFAGRLALLNEPSFEPEDILHNLRVLAKFQERTQAKASKVHKRATLYSDVAAPDVVKLLRELRCPDEASQVSFSQYADYLDDWLGDQTLPKVPRVNIAIMDAEQHRRRVTSATRPTTAEEARRTTTTRFGPIVGGQGGGGAYKGDAFLDKDETWHKKAPKAPKKERAAGDAILIVLYKLNPNYVTKKLFDRSGNGWRTEEVMLRKGDRYYVGLPKYTDKELSVLAFAAWTPVGGPMYAVATNKLVALNAGKKLKQRGRIQLTAGGDDAEE